MNEENYLTPPKLPIQWVKRIINPKYSRCYHRKRFIFYKDDEYTIEIKYLEKFMKNIKSVCDDIEPSQYKKMNKKAMIDEYERIVKEKIERKQDDLEAEDDFNPGLIVGILYDISISNIPRDVKESLNYSFEFIEHNVQTYDVVFSIDEIKNKTYIEVDGKVIGVFREKKTEQIRSFEDRFVDCYVKIHGGRRKILKDLSENKSYFWQKKKEKYELKEDFVPYKMELYVKVK